MAKLPVILGNLDITIDNVSSDCPSKWSVLCNKQPTCLSSWLFLWSVLLGISFQIIWIHHTFPWGNSKPVVNLHSRLKWRSLCPAYPNTPSLIPSTAITFTFTRSTWNTTVRSLSPRWVHRRGSLLYNLAFRLYIYIYKCAGDCCFFFSLTSFSPTYPCRPEILLFALSLKTLMKKTLNPWRFVCFIHTHIYIICIYIIYLYFT